MDGRNPLVDGVAKAIHDLKRICSPTVQVTVVLYDPSRDATHLVGATGSVQDTVRVLTEYLANADKVTAFPVTCGPDGTEPDA
jgi:hypothetical protein